MLTSSVAYRWGCWGFEPPPPKFRSPSKIVPNSTWLWKLLKIAEFRKPSPQDVRKKGSKILKLPPVRNCLTLAMTDKLLDIISSLKVPKIKKILLYEMKFLVKNHYCLQNSWLGSNAPRSPFSLSSVRNWICWTPPQNKIPGYATVRACFLPVRTKDLSAPRYLRAISYSSVEISTKVPSHNYDVNLVM